MRWERRLDCWLGCVLRTLLSTLASSTLVPSAPRRDAVVPLEAADPTDAFGLLSTGLSRRIGAAEGPKARVLVSEPRLPVSY